MSQTLAELFNVDTKEEDAILESALPDVPVVKQLEDGIIVIGVSGKNAARKPCTITRSEDRLVCKEDASGALVFDIALDTPELKEAIAFAYSGEKPAIIVFDAIKGGMIVYSTLNFA